MDTLRSAVRGLETWLNGGYRYFQCKHEDLDLVLGNHVKIWAWLHASETPTL